MATIHLTRAQWGGARPCADGKIKTWKRAKDKSQQIRWRKSRRKTVISRAKARGMQTP